MGRLLAVLSLLLRLAAQAPQEGGAAAIVDGTEVVRFRLPLGSFSPQQRAEQLERAIRGLARTSGSAPVEIREAPGMVLIYVSGNPVMVVTEADARLEGLTPALLAGQHAASIRRAIREYNHGHSWRNLLTGLLKTLAIWTLFAGALWALKRALELATRRIGQWFDGLAEKRGARGLVLLLFERLSMLALFAVKIATAVFLLVWFSILLTYTFSLFPATQNISVSLVETVWGAIRNVLLALFGYLPRGLFVAVVCALAYYGLQMARILFAALERGDVHLGKLHPEIAGITYQLFRGAVVILVLIIIFPYLPGSHTDAFKGISIFLGVVLSLGSGSAVSNLMAGVVLAYMRPFRVGDRVKIADTLGDVVQRGTLVTRVRTIKNVEVTIPNSAILGAQILNYSTLARDRGLILNTAVTIGYNAPWRTVHNLLIQAALATPGILPDPAPFVLETSLNDYHVSYEINAYTDRPNEMINIYSELHAHIQDAFNAAGVEIMSPSYLSLRDGNTVTIPEAHRPADYRPEVFRVKPVE